MLNFPNKLHILQTRVGYALLLRTQFTTEWPAMNLNAFYIFALKEN